MADVPRKDMDIEDLLRRADFSRETDFKERLWKHLTEQMEQESLIVDLDDDDLVQAAGAEVAAVVLLVDRSKGSVKFGDIPMFSLVQIQPTTWEPAACPLCAAGGHPVHPGS